MDTAGPRTVPVAASHAPTTTAVQDTGAWDENTLGMRVAGWFHARGVRSAALATFSIVAAGGAAFLLLVSHPGLGALFGLVALAASELAQIRQPAPAPDTTRLGRGLTPLADLLIVGGMFGGIATQQKAPMIGLAFLVVMLLAWLPMLRSNAGQMRLADAAELWRRSERMAILLIAILLGRPGPALMMILVVCGLEAWLRVERLAVPLSLQAPPLPEPLRHVIGDDGTLTPVARGVTFGLTLLLILALPQSAYWRF